MRPLHRNRIDDTPIILNVRSMRNRLANHTVRFIPVYIRMDNAHIIAIRRQHFSRPADISDKSLHIAVTGIKKHVLFRKPRFNRRKRLAKRTGNRLVPKNPIKQYRRQVGKDLFRFVYLLVIGNLNLILNSFQKIILINSHAIRIHSNRSGNFQKLLEDFRRKSNNTIHRRTARLFIKRNGFLGRNRKVRKPITVVQTPSGANLLYRFGRHNIRAQLPIGIKDAVNKKFPHSPIIHIKKGIASDKAACCAHFLIILEEEEKFPRSVSSQDIRKNITMRQKEPHTRQCFRQFCFELKKSISLIFGKIGNRNFIDIFHRARKQLFGVFKSAARFSKDREK